MSTRMVILRVLSSAKKNPSRTVLFVSAYHLCIFSKKSHFHPLGNPRNLQERTTWGYKKNKYEHKIGWSNISI